MRPGEVLGVVAPAGPVDEERLRRGVAELEGLGFAVRLGEGVLDRHHFAAGSWQARLRQIESLVRDPEVRAIVAARGGAGLLHLLPHLDLGPLRADPRPVVGYSDLTLLHQALACQGLTSLHGPMVARELAEGEAAYDRDSLWAGLTGEGDPVRSRGLITVVPGEAEGVLRGGCLSLLVACAGTDWALRTAAEPTILLLEDVDERPYRVDRMLRQLRLSGAFAGVRGVVFGPMAGCDADEDEGYRLLDVVREALEGFRGPVASGVPSGHRAQPMTTLPLGLPARLSCTREAGQLEILEPAVTP